jgi:hypothetical protein
MNCATPMTTINSSPGIQILSNRYRSGYSDNVIQSDKGSKALR